MEMRRLTGDESALWFVWQKQESNNWSFTASELACLFCFIEHVKAQGSQNITIYHPSKNMPSWQRNQNYNILQGLEALIRWMKDAKAEMCTSSSSDLVLKLGHNYIYINKSAFYRHSNQIKKIKFPLQPLFVKTWRRISKVTENYCNLYCCISVHGVSDFIHYQAPLISDCSHNDISSIKIAMLITSSDNDTKL